MLDEYGGTGPSLHIVRLLRPATSTFIIVVILSVAVPVGAMMVAIARTFLLPAPAYAQVFTRIPTTTLFHAPKVLIHLPIPVAAPPLLPPAVARVAVVVLSVTGLVVLILTTMLALFAVVVAVVAVAVVAIIAVVAPSLARSLMASVLDSACSRNRLNLLLVVGTARGHVAVRQRALSSRGGIAI